MGFWAIFAGLAWRDLQTLTEWMPADAMIIGRRETLQTDSAEGSTRRTRTAGSSSVTPEFALRYQASGVEILSTGYDTGTSLRIGGRVTHEQEMRDWRVGKVIPCWYNPADPTDVVVRRGFGGAYFFALFPLPICWLGLQQLRVAIAALRHSRLPVQAR